MGRFHRSGPPAAEDVLSIEAPTTLDKNPPVKLPSREEQVFLWFPAKRPPLEVIQDLHPGIIDVKLPRRESDRFCLIVFATAEEALKARKFLHRKKYEGSNGRKLKASIKKESSHVHPGKRKASTDGRKQSAKIISSEQVLKEEIKEEPESTQEEESMKEKPVPVEEDNPTKPNSQTKRSLTYKVKLKNAARKVPPRTKHWNSRPGAGVRTQPGKKQHFANSRPGAEVRIQPGKKTQHFANTHPGAEVRTQPGKEPQHFANSRAGAGVRMQPGKKQHIADSRPGAGVRIQPRKEPQHFPKSKRNYSARAPKSEPGRIKSMHKETKQNRSSS